MSYNPNSTGKSTKLTGSTSGILSQFASAITSSYAIIWPSAQGAGSLVNDGSGNLSWSGSAGTVTSVALSLPGSIFSVSGSPITGSGTLNGSFIAQSANTVFAGPTSGSAVPTFRLLVSGDIPNNAANTTGTASNITASSNSTLTTLSALTTASSLSIAESQVTNLVSDLAAKQSTTLTNAHILVGNVSNVATDVAVSGDLTLANTGAFTVAKIQGVTVSGTTGTGNLVFSTSPTLVTPALGTPSALVGTNITGTAAGLTAGNVTTNANLTGDVTSTGNATTVAKIQGVTVSGTTGTGNVVFSAAPTLTGLLSGGSAVFTSTISASNLSGINTGDQTITLTGDVTGSGTGSFATTVAKIAGTTVSGTTGTGNVVFSAAPTLTGLLSGGSASFTSTISASNFSGSSSGINTGDQTITLTGDVTGSGTGSFATTLKNTGTAGTYTKVTFDAQGRETSGTSAVLASADFANQGTATTVLHGNAAGNPSFSAVSLTADVSGTLPVANGGTGDSSLTAYAVLCGGTTTTAPVQSIASVGTAGQVLTSNGAAALPTFQNAAGGSAVALIATGAPSSYTANTAIIVPTVLEDTGSNYNNSTGEFTAPTTGYYQCNAIINTNSVTINNFFVYVNGSSYIAIGANYAGNGNIGGSGTVFATSGQTIDFRYAGTWSAVGGAQSSISIFQVG